ncbi:MAG: 4Fe-4S binding protein [Candidatus Promineifilaceae bacterium]|nr:4Fe-4S binding protein [Candidatus Promineifilaceae bacterium]
MITQKQGRHLPVGHRDEARPLAARRETRAATSPPGYDLLRLPFLRRLLLSRWPQFVVRALTLGGFLLAIAGGLLGTPVGNRNAAIVFVWIAWWALLILVAVPLAGRAWCAVCPIPMAGEWLQQGALLAPLEKTRGLGLGRRWPRRFRNIWLQNGAFLLLALFSAMVLTNTKVTALVLAGLMLLATGTALIYQRRAFCRYLCPVGGFIGLYAQAAPLEVRVKDTSVCASHRQKTCYTGSSSGDHRGYGCPWGVFPGGLTKNTNCGLCFECLRTCPSNNIAFQIRPAGQDLTATRGRRLDEAYKGFIMLGSAAVYSAVMLGPWGSLKDAAYQIGSPAWLSYALVFLVATLGLLPGTFWMAVHIGQTAATGQRSTKQAFTAFAYALVPLGLAAWMAFSLGFILANISYVGPVLSDPFGWGWNLLGTAGWKWTPLLSGLTPGLQALVLVGGFLWSARLAVHVAGEDGSRPTRQAAPVVIYNLALTVGLLWLLVA